MRPAIVLTLAATLAGHSLSLVNGTGGGASVYQTIDLPGTSLGPGDHFVVCANPAATANCDLDVTPETNLIQNGAPDAVAIVLGGTVVDSVSYEGDTGAPYTEGWGAGLLDDPADVAQGISRLPDGTDTDQNNADLDSSCITPGAVNTSTATACRPPVVARIRDIQGATHFSPLDDTPVADVPGVVTAVSGIGFWFQDPAHDSNEATSEGIFVFTGSAPGVAPGDTVRVDGVAQEFFPGGTSTANLSTTEIISPVIDVLSSGDPLPSATVIGAGGRLPPTEVIDDDATGDVNTSGTFDPATDGIDFYESLEGMRVRVNDAVAVGPRNQFGEIAVATYNVENLDPTDGPAFARHAELIVDHLRSPDLIAIEEIQDNDGAANTSTTDASTTWGLLISAIEAAGGPTYEYRQIDPEDDQDGGEPGGNIRVGFLFRTDRGLSFTDRPGGDATTPTTVIDHPSGPMLSASPGRIDPENSAWADSRKPLAGEFRMRGRKVFVIATHFNSKGGDHPLFGRFQPPVRSSEVQRHQQAEVVNGFVDDILAADPYANVIVLGDINDFEFSQTVDILEGEALTTLMDSLPKPERYSYVFEGNSQVLDQILVSNNLLGQFDVEYDPVHVNSEFADQASDRDPQVARLDLRGRPGPK